MTWLKDRGVQFRRPRRGPGSRRGQRRDHRHQHLTLTADGPVAIPVTPGDLGVTNGSTADKAFGPTRAPVFDAVNRSGAWNLWEKLAQGRPAFNPAAFNAMSRRVRGSPSPSRSRTHCSWN
jgi:myosin-crossreactive antigen